jgi:hypothetical protein
VTRRLTLVFIALVGVFLAAELLMAAGAVAARLVALAVFVATVLILWRWERRASR